MKRILVMLVTVSQLVMAEHGHPGGGNGYPGGGHSNGEHTGGGRSSQVGCFPKVEAAARELRYSVLQLASTASRYEYQGATQRAAENAARQVGAYQYELYRLCDVGRALMGRDRVRDSLDPVRQAFRASPVLPNRPDAFQAFREMVTDWETLRDLVSDLQGGGQQGCFPQIEKSVLSLKDALEYLVKVASRLENRGQTEYTARTSVFEIDQSMPILCATCDKNQLLQIRDKIRNRLDGVRNSFRASPVLPNDSQAFQAFRNMVDRWEAFREVVSDVR